MDFRKISQALPPGVGTNGTELPELTDLPPNILEALIPGYSVISRYVSAYLGIDISLFVTVGVLLVAVSKAGQYAWQYLCGLFENTFMSSVYIDEHDDLFDMVMAWLAAHQESTSRNRKMRAKTPRGSKADDAYNEASEDALDDDGMFNFAKWSARTPPRFEPYYGRQWVWHGGHIFWFRRSRKASEGQRISLSWNNEDDDIIQLDCIGRSINPIKELLKTVRIWSLARLSGTTVIRHPTPKDRARFGGTWSKTTSRPSRPMDTVILDAEQKSMIIKDMNEYLHPLSPRWYATRGIPYRRGYLFHGPPGTGKTSLVFALSGVFGLEIYAISLQEPTLTEGDLMQLFNGLPRRCIVLLEDVDAAGLIRDGASEDKSSDEQKRKKKNRRQDDSDKVDGTNTEQKIDAKKEDSNKAKKDDDFTLKDLAKELKSLNGAKGNRGGNDPNENPKRQPGTGISLSGLLNAIDGVATHEGRVLILTTNYPEKLDAALIRPGRVDRKVEFRLAQKQQICELFVRMYAASEMSMPRSSESSRACAANGSAKNLLPGSGKALVEHSNVKHADFEDVAVVVSRIELEGLAKDFAARVPDDTFTPAEVQNLLMRYKKNPRTAVAKVEAWVADTLAEKEQERRAREGHEEVDGDDAKEGTKASDL